MKHYLNKQSSCSVPNNDRISRLSDKILGRILSFLPTKYAVATCILSHRWTSLWMFTSNLDIQFCNVHSQHGYVFTNEEEKEKFVDNLVGKFIDFVNYVLLLHKPKRLNKLSLSFLECQHVKLTTWISAWISVVIAKKVQVLCLGFRMLPIHAQRSIFSYRGLISLTLKCNFCLSSEIVVSLPRLECLRLISVYFLDEEAFYKLIRGCPVLKCLRIDMDCENMIGVVNEDGTHPVFKCKISSTSLTRLEVCAEDEDEDEDEDADEDEDEDNDEDDDDDDDPDIEFEGALLCIHLDTPLLEYIHLECPISNIFIQQASLPSLVKASFLPDLLVSESGVQNSFNSLDEAFCSFDCTKTLVVSTQAMSAVSIASIRTRTKFKRLKELEVRISDSSDWSSLLDVISLFDSLQVLTIDKYYDSEDDDFNNSNWKQPDRVPSCLSNSLRTVAFVDYEGHLDELATVSYILKHGSVLQLMAVYFDEGTVKDFKTKFELVQKISKFPRTSPVCELVF